MGFAHRRRGNDFGFGFDQLLNHVQPYTPEWAHPRTGLDPEQISAALDWLKLETQTANTEFRSDRFIAAYDRPQDGPPRIEFGSVAGDVRQLPLLQIHVSDVVSIDLHMTWSWDVANQRSQQRYLVGATFQW